jgi:endonuclease YncB( thermonuclease family)
MPIRVRLPLAGLALATSLALGMALLTWGGYGLSPAKPGSGILSPDRNRRPHASVDLPASPVAVDPKLRRGPLAAAYEAQVTAVVDGDTLEARVQVWFGQEIVTRIRLAGIDAPELRSACGTERHLAVAARNRLIELVAGKRVRLLRVSADKYFGRVVAEVVTESGEVGAILRREGLAAPYAGRRRTGWCG